MITETIKDQEEFVWTANLKAATALATLGFGLKHPTPVTRTIRTDKKESTVFWFNSTNDKGDRAEDILLWMTKGGEDLEKQDPEHIVNYLRAYAANRDALVDIIRNTPRHIVIERNGKRIAVREDASEEDKKALAKHL
jgi:hypothetical protein